MNLVFFCAININRTMIPSRAASLSISYAPSLFNGTRRTVKPEGAAPAASLPALDSTEERRKRRKERKRQKKAAKKAAKKANPPCVAMLHYNLCATPSGIAV